MGKRASDCVCKEKFIPYNGYKKTMQLLKRFAKRLQLRNALKKL